ncbi:hypothetical protein LJK87_45270 [Paenibacillus sp. P25]|nr:hypothetical protein LJK87_45270 [Paenibacillus sp. P25]
MYTERVPLSAESLRTLESSIMLFYTGITRSASRILKQQKDNTLDKTQRLISLRNQSIAFMNSLRQGEVDKLGSLLHRGWELKRRLADGISNPEIDDLYRKALEAGALGGKIAGAGGGGFLMLYVPLPAQDRVRKAPPLQQMPVRFSRYGDRIVFHTE